MYLWCAFYSFKDLPTFNVSLKRASCSHTGAFSCHLPQSVYLGPSLSNQWPLSSCVSQSHASAHQWPVLTSHFSLSRASARQWPVSSFHLSRSTPQMISGQFHHLPTSFSPVPQSVSGQVNYSAASPVPMPQSVNGQFYRFLNLDCTLCHAVYPNSVWLSSH